MKTALNTAKNTLSQDVKLLGRSVPVFLILLVALAGTGTAALLTSFGTVSGTANVDQAVTLGDSVDFGYDAVAGERKVETVTAEHHADQPIPVKWTTNADNHNGVSMDIYKWGSETYMIEEGVNEADVIDGQETSDPQTINLSDRLGGPVELTTNQESNTATYTVELPQTLVDHDNFEFIFDTDNDGTSDFKIQYQVNSDKVDGSDWAYYNYESNSWTALPNNYSTAHSEQTYTLEIPRNQIGEIGSDYTFGFQGRYNGEGDGDNLAFGTPSVDAFDSGNQEDGWAYDASDFHTVTFGETVTGDKINLEENTVFSIITDFSLYTKSGDYYLKATLEAPDSTAN